MYLILLKRPCMASCKEVYASIITDEMNEVAQYLQQNGVKVYSLDRLKEIKEIKVTYEEVPMELT